MSISLQLATSAASVNNGSTRTLFVEGEANSIDAEIIAILLRDADISVKPLQSALALNSCAKAFSNLEPGYFFLIDRDHHSNEKVEKSWTDFRTGNGNLLIWKKKELENYFLDPDFLTQSSFLKSGVTCEQLKNFITDEANKRIFQLAANQTIIKIRETLHNKWIEKFDKIDGFDSKDSALHMLLSLNEFRTHTQKCNDCLNKENIEKVFNELLAELTDNQTPLAWGKGNWLDFIPAKPILKQLLCSNNMFTSKSKEGPEELNDCNRYITILKDLLKPGNKIPEDFILLKEVISNVEHNSNTYTATILKETHLSA